MAGKMARVAASPLALDTTSRPEGAVASSLKCATLRPPMRIVSFFSSTQMVGRQPTPSCMGTDWRRSG
jgi:hypothetical protein